MFFKILNCSSTRKDSRGSVDASDEDWDFATKVYRKHNEFLKTYTGTTLRKDLEPKLEIYHAKVSNKYE